MEAMAPRAASGVVRAVDVRDVSGDKDAPIAAHIIEDDGHYVRDVVDGDDDDNDDDDDDNDDIDDDENNKHDENDDDDDDDDSQNSDGSRDDDEDGEEEYSDDDEEDENSSEEPEYFREDGEEDQEEEEEESDSDTDSGEEEKEENEEKETNDKAGRHAAGKSGTMAGDEGADSIDESDSEDEMPINTVGNVPLEWYDDMDHVGYDLDGQKIMRGTRKDELDALIQRFDNPNASRTVHDYLHGVDVVLSEEDMGLIKRLQKRRYPHTNMNPYPEAVQHDYADKLHPLSNAPPRKSGFVPSRWEAKQVMRLVMAMRSEQYQKSVENRRKQDAKNRPGYSYLIWDEKSGEQIKHHRRLPPPKVPLPGNAESFNPPAEYLFTEDERAAWEQMDPSDRPSNFIPHKYDALRHVPLYDDLIKERFDRCLDLYLCPRSNKQKLDIDPDSLLPKLPKPSELRPFPERLSFSFNGHCGRVYSVSVSPSGEWLLTASADGSVRLWEISTGRCERTWDLGGEVRCVAFCPLSNIDLAAAIVGKDLAIFLPNTTCGPPADAARTLLTADVLAATTGAWEAPSAAQRDTGVLWQIAHVKAASSVVWHCGGDYMASLCPEGATRAVLLHQVSKRTTGSPFSKSKGRVEAVAFHPSKCVPLSAHARWRACYHMLHPCRGARPLAAPVLDAAPRDAATVK